jgi:hypothetical protein
MYSIADLERRIKLWPKLLFFYSQHWMVIDIIPERIKSLFLNPDKRFFGLKFNDTDDLRQCMILKIKKNKTNFKM